MLTLMITGCGGHFMGDTVDCYRQSPMEFRIIGVASQPDPFVEPLVDEYYQVPVSSDPEYIDILLDMCRELRVDILIPTIDDEIFPLYCRREEFEAVGTKVSADIAGMYGSDKAMFLDALEEFDIPHPMYATFKTADGCEEAVRSLGYPEKDVVVKLPNKAGSRGVRILSTRAYDYNAFANQKPGSKLTTLDHFLGVMKNKPDDGIVIAQEFLPGAEYSVDLLADHGETVMIVGRRNTVIDNSIPFESVLEINKTAYDISKKIVKCLNLDGNIGFDFIFDEHGNPIPIELNARITATISLCAWGGCNLALARAYQLLGDLDTENARWENAITYGRKLVRRSVPHFLTKDGAVAEIGGVTNE